MERDFIGLISKDTVKKEGKEIDGFEAFKNHLDGGIQSAHWLQLHRETKQAVPVMNPFFRPVFAGAPGKLAGVPVTSHSVLPSTGPFFGHPTEPWFRSSKVASAPAPAQLTIFYGGMVNVYDGISPEKAQAIMFMAGNGSLIGAGNSSPTRTQAPAPTPMTPIRPQPCSAVSSPISVSSHPFGQPSRGPPQQNERVMSSLGQAMQSAVPQARKASLARFLEKRKERVMSPFPYSLSKNNIDYASSSNNDAIAVAIK